MIAYIQGVGWYPISRVYEDWRGRPAHLTMAWNRYFHSRVFPGYGARVLNPIDKCSCAKCAAQQKEKET